MNTTLPDYIIARLRRPFPDGAPVVPGSTPVLSFGNVSEATVATLGLNPSRQEFLHPKGFELSGSERRFETLSSLGVTSLGSTTEAALHRIVNACNNYFRGKPYRRWFDQLEPVLKSVGASYYDGTACHLDLVQWATDPVWGGIENRDVRAKLIEEDAPFLCNQLKVGSFRLLLINGSGVKRQFERMTGIELRQAGVVKGTSAASDMSVGVIPIGTRVVAWSVNVQSSRGVCNELRAALASRVGELASAPEGNARPPASSQCCTGYWLAGCGENRADNRNGQQDKTGLKNGGTAKPSPSRDMTKYHFKGEIYCKNRLVLAVIQDFARKKEKISCDELIFVFKKELQGSLGVVRCLDDLKEKYTQPEIQKRFFTKSHEIVRTSTGDCVVCTQWGKPNIDDFVRKARQLEYEISEAGP